MSKKNRKIDFRCTEEEKEFVQRRATEIKMNLSEYAFHKIMQENSLDKIEKKELISIVCKIENEMENIKENIPSLYDSLRKEVDSIWKLL